MDRKTIALRASGILSYLLHPFMIPTYATLLFMYGSTFFSFLPDQIREMIALNIAVNTMVIPALLLFLLYKIGVVKDLSLNDRMSRRLPIAITIACYLLAMYLLSGSEIIYVVRKFLMVAILALMAVSVVNMWWKISLHLTAMGGFVAMLIILNISKIVYTPVSLAIWIVLAGALASARLLLGKHTPAQVAAGFSCGFVVCVLTMLFL